MARYVVLHHTQVAEPHFDWMIERDGALLTWRCGRWPIEPGDRVTRLPNHRLAYLTYQGPVSGGRGMVKRVAEGDCFLHELDNYEGDIELGTSRLKLTLIAGAVWEVILRE